jgi:glucose/arabinose dehydrogenase
MTSASLLQSGMWGGNSAGRGVLWVVMKRGCLWIALLTLSCALIGCGGGNSTMSMSTQPSNVSVTLSQVVGGLTLPVGLQPVNDGSGRLFVVEQGGTLRIIQNGVLLPTPFLDITSIITSGGETGLLGLAFHPGYAQNGRFFVHYDRTVGSQLQSVIAEYARSATDPNLADPNSERILLTVNQPFANHKGGQMNFGPDGFLYIALGDGGSEDDPLGNGQNTQTLLGKLLRIDVNTTTATAQYGIPPDNPFVNGGGLPEIFAFGLRNPWRFSFDTATGRLFVGDVGQDHFEEVDLVSKGDNLGWNTMEGMHCFNPMTGCNMTGLKLPIAEYDHSEGNAITGGYVYHGNSIPALQNAYVFGDSGSGNVWMLQETTPGQFMRTQLMPTGRHIVSFGQDTSGEVYAVDYAGAVLKIVPM